MDYTQAETCGLSKTQKEVNDLNCQQTMDYNNSKGERKPIPEESIAASTSINVNGPSGSVGESLVAGQVFGGMKNNYNTKTYHHTHLHFNKLDLSDLMNLIYEKQSWEKNNIAIGHEGVKGSAESFRRRRPSQKEISLTTGTDVKEVEDDSGGSEAIKENTSLDQSCLYEKEVTLHRCYKEDTSSSFPETTNDDEDLCSEKEELSEMLIDLKKSVKISKAPEQIRHEKEEENKPAKPLDSYASHTKPGNTTEVTTSGPGSSVLKDKSSSSSPEDVIDHGVVAFDEISSVRSDKTSADHSDTEFKTAVPPRQRRRSLTLFGRLQDDLLTLPSQDRHMVEDIFKQLVTSARHSPKSKVEKTSRFISQIYITVQSLRHAEPVVDSSVQGTFTSLTNFTQLEKELEHLDFPCIMDFDIPRILFVAKRAPDQLKNIWSHLQQLSNCPGVYSCISVYSLIIGVAIGIIIVLVFLTFAFCNVTLTLNNVGLRFTPGFTGG